MAKAQEDKSAKIKMVIAAVGILIGLGLVAYNLGLVGGTPRTAAEANLQPTSGAKNPVVETLTPEQRQEYDEGQALLEEAHKASPPSGS